MRKRSNKKLKLSVMVTLIFILTLSGCSKKQETTGDVITEYIVEKNYPKAISALREETEYKNAEDLMKQLRYMVEASNLSCNYSYIAAINTEKGVDVILGDYGFDSDTTTWEDVSFLINNNIYFSAITADGTTLETAPDDDAQEESPVSTGDEIEKMVVTSYNNDYIMLKTDGTVEYQCSSLSTKEQENMSQWTDVVDIDAGCHVYALTGAGTVVSSDSESELVSQVSEWSNIIAISTSLDTVVGLKQDGTVVIASENKYGINDVSNWSEVVAIDTCGYFTIGLKSDGTLLVTDYETEDLDMSKVADFKNLYVPSITID